MLWGESLGFEIVGTTADTLRRRPGGNLTVRAIGGSTVVRIAGRWVPVAGATVDYAMSRAEGAGRARSAIRGGFGTTIASLAAIPAGTVCSAAGPFAAVGCATGAGLAGNSVGSSLGDWWYDQWYGAGGRIRGVFG